MSSVYVYKESRHFRSIQPYNTHQVYMRCVAKKSKKYNRLNEMENTSFGQANDASYTTHKEESIVYSSAPARRLRRHVLCLCPDIEKLKIVFHTHWRGTKDFGH